SPPSARTWDAAWTTTTTRTRSSARAMARRSTSRGDGCRARRRAASTSWRSPPRGTTCWCRSAGSAPASPAKSRSDDRLPAARPGAVGLAGRATRALGAAGCPAAGRDAGRGQLLARAGGGRRRPVRGRGPHRALPGAVLRPVGADGLGLGRLRAGPAPVRVVRARAAWLRRVGAGGGGGASPAAGLAVRRLPQAARGELDRRAGAVRADRPVRAVGRSAAVRSEGVLGQAGRGGRRRPPAAGGRPPAAASARGRRVRQPDPHACLGLPRAGPAGRVPGLAGAARLLVPAARADARLVVERATAR